MKNKNNKIKVYEQRFTVPFEYPVYFTHSVFRKNNPLLSSVIDRMKERRRHSVMVYVDSGVSDANPQIIPAISKYLAGRPDVIFPVAAPVIIPGGERAKNGWEGVKRVMKAIGGNHMCRHSFVIAVGGGSVLDMVGFATSLVHRGLRMIRIPSTVLAQNDAGIGVKNGMNERQIKNFVGAFAPPFAVINDFELLRTLEMKDWTGGISEAFKVAIIKDADFFSFLCRNAGRLRKRNMKAMEELIRRCAVLHLDHIKKSGDPFEAGSARPLDFGHWAGHRLEMASGNRIGHGQAVGIGMAVDSCYAMLKGFITRAELHRILDGMNAVGLSVWSPLLERKDKKGMPEILTGLEQFLEHLGGSLAVTLPDTIGKSREVNEMDTNTILEAVRFLKNHHNENPE